MQGSLSDSDWKLLLHRIKEGRCNFQSLSLSEPCMTVPDEVWSQRCTGRF